MKTVKLKDISINNRGYYGIGASAVDYDENKFTYLRITDINDDGSLNKNGLMSVDDEKSDQYLLEKNDIVFARTGASTGRNYFYDGEINNMVYAGFLIKFSLNPELVNPKFIKYYCLSKKYSDWISSSLTGSTRPNINEKQLSEMPIELPDRFYQDKVVGILDSISQKIQLNSETNNNLRELCKTNYLRIVEENSVEISLSELMDYQGGSQPPASEFQKEKNEDNIRFVQIRDFETDSYICYIPNSNKNKLCNKDDILIARYGASLGRICYGLSGAYNVALAKVLPKKAEYKELLRVILESDDFYNYINQVGQRSAQAGFNVGDIAGYTVIIPNENGLKVFNNISKNIIDKRLLMIEENRKLSELRDTLLPKLLNGEIDLGNIEI